MSYIRSVSNPEHLYVWGDGKRIQISDGTHALRTCPRHVFHGLLSRWEGDGDVTYRGASLTFAPTDDGGWRWALRYDGWSVSMYESTLHYLVSTNEYRWKKPGKRKKKS